jgi:hypothetical protein
MKAIVLFTLFILSVTFCSAQKYALIHKKWQKPIKISDTITSSDYDSGWIPLYRTDLYSLIAMVDKLKGLYQYGLERKTLNLKDYTTDHVQVLISNVKKAYADRYDISIVFETDVSKIEMKLCDPTWPNKNNEEKIKVFAAYLKDNKSAAISKLQ